jgi:ABC-type nitrate/sulfonate/bicarbonate transport system permease component
MPFASSKLIRKIISHNKYFEFLLSFLAIWIFTEMFLVFIIPNQFKLGIFRIDDILIGVKGIFIDGVMGKSVSPVDASLNSFFRVSLSIILSALLGISIGILTIYMGQFSYLISLLGDYIRGIPITFLIPFAYFVKGLSNSWWLPVALTCIPCSLIVGMAIAEQGRKIDPDRRVMAISLLGRTELRAYWLHFALWEVLSGFLIGLRAIVPYATVLVGVLEYVGLGGKDPGFGYLIFLLTGNSSDLTLILPLTGAIIAYGVCSLGFLIILNSIIGWLTTLLGLKERGNA